MVTHRSDFMKTPIYT